MTDDDPRKIEAAWNRPGKKGRTVKPRRDANQRAAAVTAAVIDWTEEAASAMTETVEVDTTQWFAAAPYASPRSASVAPVPSTFVKKGEELVPA